MSDGFHLQMDQFSSVVNFMLAICYREQGDVQLQNFETEVGIQWTCIYFTYCNIIGKLKIVYHLGSWRKGNEQRAAQAV